MQSVLVTGGSGFLGKRVAELLLEENYDVTVTSSSGENEIPVGCKVLYHSLGGIDWTKIQDHKIIVHLAANNDTRCDDFNAMWQANVRDSTSLLENTKNSKKFIFASSTAVYGDAPSPYKEDSTKLNPLNNYAVSKVSLEQTALEWAPTKQVVGLRFCNIYGPGETHKGRRMSMIGQMIRKVLAQKTVELFKDGHQRRDWVYIDDAANAVILAIKSTQSGIYNIGTGTTTSFLELVDKIERATNLVPKLKMINHPFPDEYQNHTECDISKARIELKYEPRYTVERGITEYVASSFSEY